MSKYSNTSGVVVQPGISALLRLSQEDCKFKVNPSYTVESIPPWANPVRSCVQKLTRQASKMAQRVKG